MKKYLSIPILLFLTACGDTGTSDVPSSSSSLVGTSGTFMDSRDGTVYKYVKIGTQTWMAQNLNYYSSDSKCYKNSETNCDKYGRLYNWLTAMNLPIDSCGSISCPVSTKHQGICPSGWHIPSDAEWTTLTDNVGGASTAGTELKAKEGWDNNGNGQDTYEFAALPGGIGDISYGSDDHFADYLNVGSYGYWGSATEGPSYKVGSLTLTHNAYVRRISYTNGDVFRYDVDKSFILFSVRCLQD